MGKRWLYLSCLLVSQFSSVVTCRQPDTSVSLTYRADDALPGPSGRHGHAAGTNKASPKVLWRGEYGRHPYDALKRGGLYSWGYEYLADGIPIDLENGVSLYQHAVGKHRANSVYVSTSTDHKVAMRATHVHDEKLPDDVGCYLYRIRPNRQAIPISESLGKADPYPDQFEYAFVGYVPDVQIDGWYTVTPDNHDEIMASIESGLPSTRSKYFSRAPKLGSASVSEASERQFQLAGFPDSHEAWKLPQYAKYKGQKTSKHLIKFLETELKSPQEAEVIRKAQKQKNFDTMDDPEAVAAAKGKTKSRFRNVLKKLVCKRSGISCELESENETVPQVSESEISPGGEGAKGDKQPSVKETQGTPEDNYLEAIAEKTSKSTFDSLMKEYGHENLIPGDKLYTELRGRLSEFTQVSRATRIAGLSREVAGGAFGLAGLGFYGEAIADVFSSDSSVLDKSAVLTSIIPGVGCAVQAADSAQHGGVNAVHTALCFTEDALTLAGFWEIALVMQLMETLADWVKEKDAQNALFDTDVLMQKCIGGWNKNIDLMLNHLSSKEFVANAATQLSAYKITILYQTSQLAGDLHAAHVLASSSVKAGTVNDSNNTSLAAANGSIDIGSAIQPALRRHICVEIARTKVRLLNQLESVALNHSAKMEHEYKERFLEDYLAAATKPIPFVFGINTYPRPDLITDLKQDMEIARSNQMPLYPDKIKATVKNALDQLETPESCRCSQGKKQRRCEFVDCSSPPVERGSRDAGGRMYAARVLDEAVGKRMRISDECMALFEPCQSSTSVQPARQLWCGFNGTQA